MKNICHIVGREWIARLTERALFDITQSAVGTLFDVYKKSNGTVVTAVEGRVAVYFAPLGLFPRPSGEPPTLSVPAEAPTSSPDSSPRKPPSHRRPLAPHGSSSSVSGPEGHAQQPESLTLGLTSGSSFLLAAGEQVTVTADSAQRTRESSPPPDRV